MSINVKISYSEREIIINSEKIDLRNKWYMINLYENYIVKDDESILFQYA